MLSLIKSVFSNAQDEKALNVLIIGECESGKTSLFNLIGSFHNKSKYDILNTVIPTGNKNGICALGFNTKKITFNKKPLKIYDLEGTATNTTNIYDYYYDDADVIFYVIDAKDEKHIFKAILYLSCLSTNGGLSDGGPSDGRLPGGKLPDGKLPDGRLPDGRLPDGKLPDGKLPDESTTCKKGRQFLKPIFILGNKSEDTSAFFSAPCISNYINSIDVYKNERFWQFLLSSENNFLKHYLGVLHEKVLNCAFADDAEGEQTDQKKTKGEGNQDGQNGEITKNERYDTKEENIQKAFLPEQAQKKTHSDIVKDIKRGRKGAITVEDIENDQLLERLLKKVVNDHVNNYKRIPIQVYNISVLRNKGVYEVVEKIFDEYFFSGMYTNREGDDHTGKPSIHPRDSRMHHVDMTEQLHTVSNSAYVMYERNSSSVNLFIEHIQHLYFGKSTFDNVPKKLFFLHQGNAKYRKKYKIKKKDQLGENGTAAGLKKGEAAEQMKKTYDAEETYDAEKTYDAEETYDAKETYDAEETYNADETYEAKETLCPDRTLSLDNPPPMDKAIPEGKSGEGEREHTKGEITAIGVNDNSGGGGANAEVKREELDIKTGEVSKRTKIEQKGEISQVGHAAEERPERREDVATEAIKGEMHPNSGEFIEDEAESEEIKSRDLFQADKEQCCQNYANLAHHTDYSSNEETPKRGSPLCEENHINGHMDEGKNVIRKGKINKKKYFIVEKKKKKKFLHSGKKINDVEENSSNSLEDVNLMNVMRIDSLNKI
ncbi:hypothetical protein PCYB_126410 [Plasmodium cynomolgi strain B]|uniref:Uncharacterized protein n=1 Tax=Plasmodium cynomolgi (strain B) TaxID=1120755 RepID=K6UEB8_PLACD|nr:hypothetical protein PCYB_126410 [Plasmodium cynomolgi strain B]GAB68076.1 hypothetical protein PCYB_126410 [Plasmodium cynomolgi strain B]